MKKIKLFLLLTIIAISIIGVGSAALSDVSFDRSVSGGKILVDSDPNVAIQITDLPKYEGLVEIGQNGAVSLNLNKGISSNSNLGFNSDAVFSVGSAESGAILIKNNSDIPIVVSLTNDSSQNSISINPVNGSDYRIGVGQAVQFYFTIDTTGYSALEHLNAVMHIESQ